MGLWISIGTAMGVCFGSAFSSNASEDEIDDPKNNRLSAG
jgi:hypothetical protein